MTLPPAAPPGTVDQALALAKTLGVPRLDAQRLLAHSLGHSRTWLVAHGEAHVNPVQAQQFAAGLQRLVQAEPLAYLLGEKEFHGLTLTVTPEVLVPRADTELLVEWALELLRQHPASEEPVRVVDLGTGSGAIALAVKHAHPGASCCATDLSAAALAVAQANAKRLGLVVEFVAGPWWRPLRDRRFHLVLSNPPYIAEGDRHLAALTHEPQQALTSGPDGLHALTEIATGAARHLHPGGWLLLEHGHDQGEAVRGLLGRRGYAQVQTRLDLAGLDRCTGGQLRGPPRRDRAPAVRPRLSHPSST